MAAGGTGEAAREPVLVMHPGALGDVLQAVPALLALRAGRGPVALAAQPRLARLLAGLGACDEALDFDGLGLEALFVADADPVRARARLGRYRRVVSWFGAGRDPYPARLRALVHEAIVAPALPPPGAPGTVWEHLAATLGPWGLAPAPPRALAPPAEWRQAARDALARLRVPAGAAVLVLHPGAGGRWKHWPPERHARALAAVTRSVHVVLHEGPADAEAAAATLAALAARAPGLAVTRLVQPELATLAGVLAGCAAYLGADSGISHLAAAVGAPAVVLYPPATAAQWAPWSPTAHPLPMTEDEGDVAAAAAAVRAALRAGAARRTP
jgi:hypothetical protein